MPQVKIVDKAGKTDDKTEKKTRKRHHRTNTKSSRPFSIMTREDRLMARAIRRTMKPIKGKFGGIDCTDKKNFTHLPKEWR